MDYVSKSPFVIGHATSGTATVASPIYEENKIFFFSAVNDNLFNRQHSPFIFRIIPAARDYEPHVRDEIISSGKSNIAIVHSNIAVHLELVEPLRNDLEAAGVKVKFFYGINDADKDFISLITKLKALNVDAIVLAMDPTTAGLFVRQAADQLLVTTEKSDSKNPLLIGYRNLVS